MIPELRRNFEERKFHLIKLLERGELDISKQHQVYGAVKEIENILKSMDDMEHSHIEERLNFPDASKQYFQRLS